MAEGVARGIFYIVGEDPSSGIDFPAADLRMKADAVLTGRPPVGWFKTYAKEGWIFVYQDVRGRYGSEGEFRHMTPHIDEKKDESDVDESSDTYDTVEWLIQNVPNNNGNVGITGNSYGGYYSVAGMISNHPNLKCAAPTAPIGAARPQPECRARPRPVCEA